MRQIGGAVARPLDDLLVMRHDGVERADQTRQFRRVVVGQSLQAAVFDAAEVVLQPPQRLQPVADLERHGDHQSGGQQHEGSRQQQAEAGDLGPDLAVVERQLQEYGPRVARHGNQRLRSALRPAVRTHLRDDPCHALGEVEALRQHCVAERRRPQDHAGRILHLPEPA